MGKTSVGELMSLVGNSALVIGNDSACLHMAVGFDRPLVGLYGPTRVDLVGPYGRSHQVVQRVGPGDTLDHKDARAGACLMARITVEDVAAKVRQVLGVSAADAPMVQTPAGLARAS
jgi:ADP-heptose:LPS heptosyltransferase